MLEKPKYAPEKIPLLENGTNRACAEMAAERYSSEVLRMFYGPIAEQKNPNLPQQLEPEVVEIDDVFVLARRNNFREWLRVWKMVVSAENVNNNDLLAFARENKEKFINVVENEIKELNSVKVSFGLKAEFSIIRNDEIQTMQHYFQENEPHIFNRHDEDYVKIEFDRFVETTKGEIEAWSAAGSGWVLERIMVAYVNVARYQPLRGGKNKKASRQRR